ncbi:MAG: hypothetical protein LBT36_05825 [Oscillospiraceae bacterium]|jgi:hypothetical protein|nr:hypothetical protein [Oscillospiraceae bacterium]
MKTKHAELSESAKRQTPSRAQSRRAVIVYSAILLAVVLFFILLSYFIDRRNDHQIANMYAENAAAQTKIEKLQTDNITLLSDNAALQGRVAALELEVEAVRLEWAEDARAIEARHKAAYDALQAQFNELLERDTGV